MKIKKAVVLAVAVACSLPSFAYAQQLEGFDLSLAQTPPFPVTAFYDSPDDVSSLPVGSIIRSEPIAAPAGASAWRVLYVSERWDGTHVPASGMVIAPKQTDAKTVHPVVSWQHGTTGAARGCAPSLAPNPARELAQRGEFVIDIGVPFLSDWLAKGYVVVAPDYAGLGSNVVHRYVAGEDAGRDVHNLLRAARTISEAGIGEDVAIFGWSQGGGATLWAGEIGPTYAPENKIRSIVGLAPASTILRPEIDAFFKSKGQPFPILVGQSYIDAYKLDKNLFTAEGQKLLEFSQKNCVVGLFAELAKTDAPAVGGNVTDYKDWTEALGRNNAGLKKSETPVLVIQGLDDNIVPPGDSKAYAERAKAVGTDVSVIWVEKAGHRDLFDTKKDEIINKVVAGFEGQNRKAVRN